MEALCFQLQDSVREVQGDLDQLCGEIQSSREELQVAGKEVHQHTSTQAKLVGVQMLGIEGEIKESGPTRHVMSSCRWGLPAA